MTEILDDLDILGRPALDLATLSLAGTPFGSRAANSVDRSRISQVSFAPIVHRLRFSSSSGWEYYDADGRRLPFDEVVDSVFADGGMLHMADQNGYRVIDGKVAGFALSAWDGGYLTHFAHLQSYQEFLIVFGTPDLAKENWDTGELMGYSNYYWSARKMVQWDSWRDHLSFMNLGAYEGNDGPS